jgi:hypothetical protein
MKNREQLSPLSFFGAAALTVIIGVGCTHSDKSSQFKYSEVGNQLAMSEKKVEQPSISGDWGGTWGVFHPNQTRTAAQDTQRQLVCHVVALTPDKWEATFEGECGRPYKYTIQMLGHRTGDVVLFKGSVDLGEKDGGVYDWIGRATEEKFIGFYTSQNYTGAFQMARLKEMSDAKNGRL